MPFIFYLVPILLMAWFALSALRSALEQKERLARIVDSSGDAIISETVQGTIVSWNTGAERIYGYSAREVKGQPISILARPGEPNEVVALIERIKRGEQIKNYEATQVRKDGRHIDVSLTLSPIRNGAGHLTGISTIARDITEHKRAERRLAVQYAVAHALANSATFDEAAPKILAALCENLGWELGAIWGAYRHERVVLRCSHIWHLPSAEVTEFKVISQRRTFSPNIELPGRVWARGEPVWIANVVDDSDFLRAPYAAKVGLRGAVGFPIRLGRQILGVIEFFSRDMPPPDEDLLNMMATIGSQIGQFVECKRAEEALEIRGRQQAAISEIGQRALTSDNPARLIDEAVAVVARALGTEYAAVLELLSDGKKLLLRAGVGWKDGYVGHALVEPSRDADPVNTLIATEPVILEDLRAETRFGGLPLLSEHGVVSGVSVLIRGQERPFGVLGAYTTKQQTPSNEDVHFLQSIAYILTTTIEHKRAE